VAGGNDDVARTNDMTIEQWLHALPPGSEARRSKMEEMATVAACLEVAADHLARSSGAEANTSEIVSFCRDVALAVKLPPSPLLASKLGVALLAAIRSLRTMTDTAACEAVLSAVSVAVCSKSGQTFFKGTEISGPLVELLHAPVTISSTSTTTLMCRILATIAFNNADSCRRLGEAGVTRPIVALLSTPIIASSAVAAGAICCALASISRNDDNRRQLGEAGVAGPLVELLRAPVIASSTDTAKLVLYALVSLSCNDDNRRMLGEAGVARPLVALLSAPVVASSESAATLISGAVANITISNPDNRRRLGEAGVVGPLVGLLRAPVIAASDKAVEQMCRALANIAINDADNCRQLGETDFAGPLVALLSKPVIVSSESATKELCKLLYCLATCSPNLALILVTQGAASTVNALLRSLPPPEITDVANRALSVLCSPLS